ncbi:MAG: PKD domain-containing protein, partial [Anaerolineae bacterium]|nr:PKD domain-containing protein [Anaerolineae bacterium]
RHGNPLLTDFGFSQGIDLGITESAYLSPEIAQGQAYDQRADIYALGVLLDAVISGVSVVPGSIPNVRTRRPELAPQIEPIILKATTPQPEHRYQSVAEFQRALSMTLGGMPPVTATQPAAAVPSPIASQSTASDKASSSGNKLPLLIGGLVALLAVVGLGLFFLMSGGGGNDAGRGDGGIVIVVPTPAPQGPSVTADANINIRSGPSTEFEVIGRLDQGQNAEALGRSPDQQWWVIKVAAANNGQGWVAADFVTTTNTDNLPVIQPPAPPAATAAPTPEPDSPPVAVIEGTSVAQVGDPINLTGQNSQPADGRTIVNYEWDFDDGSTATGRDVSHVFNAPGRYDVELTVTDDLGLTGSTTFRVRIEEQSVPVEPPQAVISAPTDGVVDEPVTFDGSQSQSANRIVSYEWQFGDGGSANAVRVDHIYNAPGVYNVILVVTDNEELESSRNFQINIEAAQPEPEAPTAVINPLPDTQVGAEVTLNGSESLSGSSAITTYTWDFGDGTTDNTGNSIVTHVYDAVGSYRVKLTVTNDEGLSNQTNANITITPPEAVPLSAPVEPENGQ